MPRINSTIAAAAVALLLGACDVEQTQEARAPDVDVEGGQAPKFDVDAPEVSVGTEQREVTVPDVDVSTEQRTVTVPDVDVKTEKRTVTVPDVDIKRADSAADNARDDG